MLWIANLILVKEHKKEVERIIYENPDPNTGFIIAPDFKWTGKQVAYLDLLKKTTHASLIKEILLI